MNRRVVKPFRALIVDDERSICDTLAGALSDEGWGTLIARNGEEGLAVYKSQPVNLVFLDVWMEGLDGIQVLQMMRDFKTGIPIVVMSGHGNIETAVRVTKLGAFDFLEKPLSLEKILPLLEYVENRAKRSLEEKPTSDSESKYELVGVSKEMEAIRRQIQVVAPRNSWVLITGENGTGKEVVARNIHWQSLRASQAFVAVNCAAIPEELIESELFGHTKGAFTNAIQNKRGKFELAHRGTLFLDEIGDMSLKTQAKVLRILQEQCFEPVGSSESVSVDVRVLAATNQNLKEAIREGRFREDLFYRLNVIPIHMSPLRERREDIPVLVHYFLGKVSQELHEPIKRVSEEAMTVLTGCAWPGNVRELRNLLERLCILLAGEEITRQTLVDLAADLFAGSLVEADSQGAPPLELDWYAHQGRTTLREARDQFEKSFILSKLDEFDWNISKTAEAIGIERSNLHRKLRAYDIEPKKQKS